MKFAATCAFAVDLEQCAGNPLLIVKTWIALCQRATALSRYPRPPFMTERMCSGVSTAVLGLLSTAMRSVLAPGATTLPDVFGAIAVDTDLNYGTAWNYKSEEAAKTEALRRCKSVSHRADCKIAVSVADVCVSLSVSKTNRLYAIGGPTGAVNYAEANSNLHCQRAGGKACVIAASFCADGVRHIVPLDNGTNVPFGRSIRK